VWIPAETACPRLSPRRKLPLNQVLASTRFALLRSTTVANQKFSIVPVCFDFLVIGRGNGGSNHGGEVCYRFNRIALDCRVRHCEVMSISCGHVTRVGPSCFSDHVFVLPVFSLILFRYAHFKPSFCGDWKTRGLTSSTPQHCRHDG
jgi:hypothetical protein